MNLYLGGAFCLSNRLPDVTDQEWLEVNQDNRELCEEFLQQGHLSPKTLEQYKSGLRIFFRWVKDNASNKPLFQLKPRDALRYQNWMISLGLSSSAIKFKRSAVSSLCGYVEIYYADDDDYKSFRNIYNKKIPSPPPSKKHEKKPLSKDEYELLVKTLEEQGKWQQLAYVKFTYFSGCRRAEAAQLLKEIVGNSKAKDNNGEKSYYMTHNIRAKGRGKEGKVRKFQFNDEVKEAVQKWLEVRGEDDNPYVFVKKTKEGKIHQLKGDAFNYWCSDIFEKIVGRRIHPHLFRSTRATHLVVDEGKDIEKVKDLLGHLSSETTKIYVVKETQDSMDDLF